MSTTTTTPAVKTWGDLRPSAPPMSSAATTAASSSSAGNGGKASKQAPFALFGQLPDDQKATSLEDDFNYGVHVASCSVDVRMKFLRKVYGIVAAQLLVTSIVTGIFQFPAISAFVQTFEAGVLLSALFAFVSLVALFVKRHQFPTNLYLLGAFTLAEAYLVGTIVTFYQIHSVLQAAVITTTVVAGLTLFAFQTKYDFTIFNGLLGMLLFSLIGIGFALSLVPTSDVTDMVYAIMGAVLFSGFIVVDTQRLLHKVSTDEYILCAVDLYLDMINLFIRILEIVGKRK